MDYKLPAQFLSSFVGEDVERYEQAFAEHNRAGKYKPMGYKPFRDSLALYFNYGAETASTFIDRSFAGKPDKMNWREKNQLALTRFADLMSSDTRLRYANSARICADNHVFEEWFTYSKQKDGYSGSVKVVMSPHFTFEYRKKRVFVYVVPSKIKKSIHLHSLYSLGMKSLPSHNDGFIVIGLHTGDAVYDIGIERVYKKVRKTAKTVCINILDRLPDDVKQKYTIETKDEDIEFDVS